jgi:hypothetical protein
MGREFINSVVAVLTAIIGVAVIAVIVSQKSNTASVIGAFATGFAKDLQAATAPVTGSNPS